MDAGFRFQPAIRRLAQNLERRGFDARHLAVLAVHERNLEASLFGPARIHAEHDAGPVLRLRPARARIDLQVGVVAVELAGQKARHFAPRDFLLYFVEGFFRVGDERFITLRLRHLDHFKLVGKIGLDRAHGADLRVEPCALAQNFLRPVLVGPELRVFSEGV